LKRSLNDSDHEVRERAYFYYKVLLSKSKENKEIQEKEESEKIQKLNRFAFSTKLYDVDVLQNILQMQKEALLLSENISSDLSKILKNPDTIAKMLIDNNNNLNQNKDKGVNKKENNNEAKENKKDKKEEKSDISSIITKAYGTPKMVTKFVVI
jgi:hypothetical protein